MTAHRAIWKVDARTCAAKAQDSLARNGGHTTAPEMKSFISELRGQILARGAKKTCVGPSKRVRKAPRRDAAGATAPARAVAYGLQLPQGS